MFNTVQCSAVCSAYIARLYAMLEEELLQVCLGHAQQIRLRLCYLGCAHVSLPYLETPMLLLLLL